MRVILIQLRSQGEEVDLQVHWVVVSRQYLNEGRVEHFNLNAFQIPMAF